MDNSHIALVSMNLGSDGFSDFRCDRGIALGINISSLTKILKCGGNNDILTLRAEDTPDSLSLIFEDTVQDRISEYSLKLMDVNHEHLTIPETEYSATVTMPSAEFQRICRDLSGISDSVKIDATKEGVRFSCEGEIGTGAVNIKPFTNLEKEDLNTSISISDPVSQSFNLQYLQNICKASGLSSSVTLQLLEDLPISIEYKLPSGFLRFYLAPKISDDE